MKYSCPSSQRKDEPESNESFNANFQFIENMRGRGIGYSMRKQTNSECGTFDRTTDLVSITVNGIS